MPHNNLNYEFGPYQLDLSKRVLSRNGETISLTPKATEILVMLVSNAGQLVERDELLRQVWPDTFVEEANLSQNIFLLRRALGDERAGPRFIETVVRRGYRFIADVSVVGGNGQRVGDTPPNALMATRSVVAVLPFLNTTGDSELEYLADGVTDNLINNLSRVSQLRVMSHSSIGRYKLKTVDPQQVGKDLGASAVLVGRIHSRRSAIGVSVELVEVSTGWQLWGESFDSDSKDLLEIQDAITRHVLATLKLKLTGDEEKRVTARYTENAEAYQSYLEGRYHWSRYTRKGIEKAIGHFRTAIELDPNYALAYAAIVDCYLRLATNYLPPEDDVPSSAENPISPHESEQRVRLRFEWDWKGVERELKRANDLRIEYPAPYQWYAAYLTSQQLYAEATKKNNQLNLHINQIPSPKILRNQIGGTELTLSEQIQVYCAIVREQIDIGNYEAASRILRPWWMFGRWPTLEGLSQRSCADLLFTIGELAGCVASARQLAQGQKHGEELLNGSIALFEQLGFRRRATEAKIELALCYYRQGLFEISRSLLVRVLSDFSYDNDELRSLALIRLASLERHAGRLKEALTRLNDATAIMGMSGPWATGRCYLELASTYKDLAISEEVTHYFDTSTHFYLKALYEFKAVGNHRLAAIVENNLGYLLTILRRFPEAEMHLLRAHRAFISFQDRIRGAQVDDSLAQLYLAQEKIEKACNTIERAVLIMETGDEDALLAEALRTQGLIYCRVKKYSKAKRALEDADRLARRCGDVEGAARALILLAEEMCDFLDIDERHSVATQLNRLLADSEQPSINRQVRKCLEKIRNSEHRLT